MNAITESENVRKCPTAPDDLNERGVSLMLLAGRSCLAVAEALEIDRRTLYRWRQEEPFRFELEQRRRELWQDAADRLRGMVHSSLDVLERQLADRYDRARFTAATAVLRLAGLRKVVPPDAEQ